MELAYLTAMAGPRCVEIAKGRKRSFVVRVRGQDHKFGPGDEPDMVSLEIYLFRLEGKSLKQNHCHKTNV